jgi:hypothetical protein
VLLADLASTRRRIEWLSGRLEHTQAERRLLLAQLEEVARRAAAGAQSEQQSLAGTHALQEAEGRITQLSAALEEERRKASTADAMLLAQKRATDEAYTRIADLQSQVDQASEQDLARTEAGDLISARNLQIVDVYDTDGKGKRQRSFGRVFYVEGKSLVFYAYDLNHARNARADVTFHVWGEMAGIKATTYELGIMRSDDPAQGRWTMTFNHPRVLSRINAVYVTASDTGGKISDPQGHKLLYAFLGVPHNR